MLADRAGNVSMVLAAGLPLLLAMGAFAIDIGSASLTTRRLQGVADAAALAAAADPDRAQAAAEATVAGSGWSDAITIVATTGTYAADPTRAPDARFAASASGRDAVRVRLESRAPTFFARILGKTSIPIARNAVAARERLAGFSIGSRLASLDGGIVNALLSGLTGSSVSLSVMDYNALAGVDVDLFRYLDALRTTASLDAASYADTLAATVTTPQVLGAMASALDADGKGAAATALRKLAVQVGSQSLSLDGLIDAGSLGRQSSGGQGLARVDAMAFLTSALQIASGKRQVALDLGAGVAGLASTRLTIAIGDRMQRSPWLTVTDSGTPILRTAQARIYLEVRLLDVGLPGIGTLVGIRVPLFIEMAAAEGRLKAIDCSSAATRGVTLEGRVNAATAAIASVDTTNLSNFAAPVTLNDARLVDTLLVDVDGRAEVTVGAAEPWQSLTFSEADIAAGRVRTVSSSSPISGTAVSLTDRLQLRPRVLGLPLPLDPLLRAVGSQLAIVAPLLDSVIGVVTGAVGIRYGEADLKVYGMRCGTASLVG